MTIPGNLLSNDRPEAPLLVPDDRRRLDPTVDWEKGGVALNDPSQGLNVRDWKAWTDGTKVYVAPDPEGVPAVQVFTGTDITEVSLAFDQNMQPTLAFVDSGVAKLWWYDTLAAGMTITSYPGYKTPMLTLDDKRDIATQTGVSDIIFAYIRDGLVCWRQQRERFGVERVLGAAPSSATRIVGMGMADNNRLQIKLTIIPTALHASLLTDTLYVLTGDDIVGVGKGAPETATWRSKTFQSNEVPVMGWARVLGDYPMVLRVIGDNGVRAIVNVTSDDPVRLPSGRWREWAVEIEGTNRAIQLRLAQSVDELWD
jgi:hypothetical protein